jgi:hypothetical protein
VFKGIYYFILGVFKDIYYFTLDVFKGIIFFYPVTSTLIANNWNVYEFVCNTNNVQTVTESKIQGRLNSLIVPKGKAEYWGPYPHNQSQE